MASCQHRDDGRGRCIDCDAFLDTWDEPTHDEFICEDDIRAAAEALLSWLESQDIDLADCVPILAHTTRSLVMTIAQQRGTDVAEGLNIVADMIRAPR